MESYVFFIGGTGMRVFRSFLHLCASGAVGTDDTINVMMLDVDSTNDACTEAKALYDVYCENYNKLHTLEVLNALQGTPCPAFRVRLQMPESGGAVINPIQDEKKALDALAVDGKKALEWFYTEEERRQSLERGFFAHPNVGCLFFGGVESALLPYIKNISDTLNSEKDVRVVIVGSMFGGTGAAGIPTVLRILQDGCEKALASSWAAKKRRMHCAGVLVTPYFKFKDPAGHTGNLYIHHDLFFGNTRSALEYYDWSFKQRFDRIYLAGQDTLQLVSKNGEYNDGGKDQKNKPHIVELIAAMGVRHFLLDTAASSGSMNIYEKILRSNGNDQAPVFGWGELEWELSALGDMLRTQALIKSVIKPYVYGRFPERWPWYKTFQMNAADSRSELETWVRYTDLFLNWIYNIQYQLKEPSGDGLERDNRISLVGVPIENIMNDTPWDVSRKFADLIDNRTNATNVSYRRRDGKLILVDLGMRGKIGGKRYGSLGMTGLFTQLFDLASEKV